MYTILFFIIILASNFSQALDVCAVGWDIERVGVNYSQTIIQSPFQNDIVMNIKVIKEGYDSYTFSYVDVVDYLLVGMGGGGGKGNAYTSDGYPGGGGGGAGQCIENFNIILNNSKYMSWQISNDNDNSVCVSKQIGVSSFLTINGNNIEASGGGYGAFYSSGNRGASGGGGSGIISGFCCRNCDIPVCQGGYPIRRCDNTWNGMTCKNNGDCCTGTSGNEGIKQVGNMIYGGNGGGFTSTSGLGYSSKILNGMSFCNGGLGGRGTNRESGYTNVCYQNLNCPAKHGADALPNTGNGGNGADSGYEEIETECPGWPRRFNFSYSKGGNGGTGVLYLRYNCTSCNIGTFATSFVSTGCLNCTPGTYSDIKGMSFCFQCPLGKYSIKEAANSNRSCTLCQPGSYSSLMGSTQCIECDIGTFQTKSGSSSNDECTSCTRGTYSSNLGSTQCLQCFAGSYSSYVASSVCILCQSGTYSSKMEVSSSALCEPCQQGSYMEREGSTYCNLCQVGKYSFALGSRTQHTCITCEYGKYSTLIGSPTQEFCTSCSDNLYFPLNASQSICSVCAPGAYLNNFNDCKPCNSGFYLSTTNSSQCTKCNKGTYGTSQGLSQCSSCPSGKYSTLEGSTSDAECTNCSNQKFNINQNTVDGCIYCFPGKYSSTNNISSSCLPCEKGKYASGIGFTVCQLCSKGTFASESGLKDCLNCEIGKFSSMLGSLNCETCQNYTGTAKSGSASCELLCGYYWDEKQSQILECPEDHYCN